MTSAATGGQQVSATPMPPISNPMKSDMMKMNSQSLFKLGIAEIVLGVISSILGGLCLGFALGVWSGIVLVFAGILGTLARYYPTKSVYAVNIVLSILAVLAMLASVLISVIFSISGNLGSSIIALRISTGIVGSVGVIVAIVHCTYSCAMNDAPRTYQTRIMYRPVPQQQLIPVQMPNGQIMYYPSQTISNPSVHPSNVQASTPLVSVVDPNATQPTQPTQSTSSTAIQSEQTTPFPAYGIPMAYPYPASQPVYYAPPPLEVAQNQQPTQHIPAPVSSGKESTNQANM